MKRVASLLACLGLLAPMLLATSIEFAGIETGSAVQNWSNTEVAKSQDIDGDNRYGGVGYYQITPGTVADGIWSQSAPDGNDLGLTAFYPTLNSKPPFLSLNPAGAEGTFYNSEFFPFFCDPTGASLGQQGSLSVTINNFVPVPGGGELGWNKAFDFTLAESATFRIGVAVDTVDSIERAPDLVSISNATTGEEFSTALNRDGVPDMVFFDITGNAGDVYAVNLWRTIPELDTSGPIAFALVTFDQTPIPTLVYTLVDGNIILSWEQNIDGWILESSTDLGVGDDWSPVPYPNNNNSVTVPMAGVPKNFFRLRKNP